MNYFKLLLLFLLPVILFAAGCDCGEDDDDDNDSMFDDDIDADDDTSDDDTSDDDTTDDDTGDDDTGDDDTSDDDTVDDDTTDDDTAETCDWATHDPLIVAGKAYLSAGNDADAYGSFYEALDVCPDSADAKMGILLADTQWYVAQLNKWIGFLMNFNPAPHEEKSIGTVIQQLIRDVMQPVNYEMYELAEDLLENERDVRFYIETLPMWVDGEHVLIDLGGEWDIADVYNLYAFAELIDGLEQFLLSFDFTFNYHTFAFWPPPDPGATLIEIVHSYTGLFLALLADPDYPDFLKFLPGGEETLSDSGVKFGLGCLDMREAFDHTLLEIDPQVDDVMGYIDENGNGQYDEGENWNLPYFGPLDEPLQQTIDGALTMIEDLGYAFLDGGPEDVNPILPNWFLLSDLNWILELGDLGIQGWRLPPIPVPIGMWFYNPMEDGLRTSFGAIVQLLYDLTEPTVEEVSL